MLTSAGLGRSQAVLALALYCGLLIALLLIPRLVSPDPRVVSAAAVDGYNTVAAFWTAFGWALLVIATFSVLRRRAGQTTDALQPDVGGSAGIAWRPDWLELLAVFGLFALAFCPLFLLRYGPYGEDAHFLAVLNRMNCGQVPYRDFAFLYGPLMIYPAWAWTQIAGYGMASFYTYLSLMEALGFTLLTGFLQYFIPQRRRRYVVFVLLLPFLFNTLLGLNYNGLRWLLPTVVMLLAAHRPHHWRTNICCAGLLGLHLAYSHEYALAGLVAIVGMYAVQFLWDRRTDNLRAIATIVIGSAAVWLVTSAAVLRDSMPSYISHATDVVRMMSSGHAGFRFFWTANSLALFGLLTIACAMVGKGWRPAPGRTLESGDRLLLAAVVFALVALRSGLTRADVWHLNPGFLPLIVGVLLALPMKAMRFGDRERRLAGGLVVVASVTMLIGIAPTGSLYATSYVRGVMDAVTGVRPGVPEDLTRTRSIEFERTQPRTDFVELGQYLAQTQHSHQPVLFYGRAWDIPPLVGVCPEDYKLDDLLYSEFTNPESDYLRKHRDALVVMRNLDYRRLYGLVSSDTPHSNTVLTPVKQLGRWLSTVHYDSAETEARLQDETRERLSGAYVRSNYDFAAGFGRFVVLTPTSARRR